MLRIILLRQSWYETRCTKGSYAHLVGDFDRSGQCIVDDANNMIVLHPDHLISATVIADSFTCVRRAALQDRVKATSAAEKPQVYGHIIHAIFGEALTNNTFETQQLRDIVEKTLPTTSNPCMRSMSPFLKQRLMSWTRCLSCRAGPLYSCPQSPFLTQSFVTVTEGLAGWASIGHSQWKSTSGRQCMA